jgi:hypothetical protein
MAKKKYFMKNFYFPETFETDLNNWVEQCEKQGKSASARIRELIAQDVQ